MTLVIDERRDEGQRTGLVVLPRLTGLLAVLVTFRAREGS